MQPTDLPGSGAPPDAGKRPNVWQRIQGVDSRLSIAKGLTIVTLLTGFFGGYFQYLNAYEEKVSEQAKADMTDATSAFLDISNAFAEAETQQQLIFFDYVAALATKADAGDNKMVSDAGRDVFPDYVKARTALRQNSNVYARKTEIYVDWPSDLSRDPATPRTLDVDPLNEALLGNYNFDCNAPDNFPHFEEENAGARSAENNAGAAGSTTKQFKRGPTTIVCAVNDKGEIGEAEAGRPPIVINWQSAKHHVVTMHYCFETAHAAIEMRIWAFGNQVNDKREAGFRANQPTIKSRLELVYDAGDVPTRADPRQIPAVGFSVPRAPGARRHRPVQQGVQAPRSADDRCCRKSLLGVTSEIF